MECRQCLELMDNLIIAEPTSAEQAEMAEHLQKCPGCAHQYSLALQALAAITPSSSLRASTDFKERVMHAISSAQVDRPRPIVVRFDKTRVIKLATVVAVAVVLLLILTPLLRFGLGRMGPKGLSAFSILAEASAAEEKLFMGDQLLHMISEIIVKPIADADLAKTRWFPVFSLEANGKPRFSQLTLPAEVNKGYTVEDNSWYDPATGRFSRILLKEGKPIFANSFDGANVYSLEMPASGASRIVKKPISKDFKSPISPAKFIGIAAGLPSGLDVKDQSLVRDVGEVTLEDGTKCRTVKVSFTQGGPKDAENSYNLITIREDDNIIEKMELVVSGLPYLVIRRGKSETGREPKSGWNLAGIAEQAGGAKAQSAPVIRPDMIIPDVSVDDMVKKADFPVYVFDKDPTWAGDRKITDILDIVSPPHRMFLISYKATDHRHVVLIQSPSYNKMLGPAINKLGKVIYTSPSGIKVWSGSKDQWLANILLQSSRATIQDPPVKDPTGYILETPDGTFPTLAINGKITDEELHALVDSLVPAKK